MIKILILFILISPCFASSELYLELGNVENSYNQVRIPGDSGTKFNLANSYSDTNFYQRLNYTYKGKSRHGFRALFAPLQLTGGQTSSKNIDFRGAQFNANSKIDTSFQFNSYRASYFYQVVDDKDFILRLGATVKIREARIQLSQGNLKRFKQNTGVVPLLYLFSEYKWDNGMRVAFDFDGWAAPQGRAFDMALMGGYYLTPQFHLNLGYRVLEGGADNDTVYNFSQFNFLFTSLQYNF